ncbi:isopentenyl-diphosphate Delta-isomerase [Propioniciclava sp.]|jgi:isopentenyl-diphosphate delta-isomerase|uniref:isopentenyl-diphosphate Delta-isomerase n=1 Tax=Propioniciclava sp. TaxID=2038686 RepID=UPI0026025F1A|nr:isopentenyl-diphosphate Delta-isomerase [Propioniciclava sp.]
MNADIDDLVVLLDEHDRPIGHADRTAVHTRDTPRHLAFSCYLFDDTGRVLLTRRALTKATWPGVWTNSCCGHPRPGEAAETAVRRRVSQELGVPVDDLNLVLPDFGYRAVDASGIVENETCPVWVGRIRGPLTPDPAEVCETAWVSWGDLIRVADTVPALLSPWCALQVPLLEDAMRKAGAA